MPDLIAGPGDLRQCRALMPVLAAGRPVFFRSDRGFGPPLDSPSADGGCEEFFDVRLTCASSPAIRSTAAPSCPRDRTSSPCAAASSARRLTTSAASTSYDGD